MRLDTAEVLRGIHRAHHSQEPGTRHRTWARESSDQSYSNRVDGRLLGSVRAMVRADRRGASSVLL